MAEELMLQKQGGLLLLIYLCRPHDFTAVVPVVAESGKRIWGSRQSFVKVAVLLP
jgi:hypothetical protein